MITTERIDKCDDFAALEPEWTRLLCNGGYHTIFQTYPWLSAWWDCLADNNELYVLVIREGAKIIGLAPLMLGPDGVIRFIGTPNVDYSDIIGADKPKLWTAVVDYLKAHQSDWNTVLLDQLTDRATSHEFLKEALERAQLTYRSEVGDVCMAYQFEGSLEDAQKFELRRGTNLKKATRQLDQMGKLVLERLSGEEALHHLHNLFHLHIMRWSQTPTPSKFEQEKHRRFYAELIKRLGPNQAFFTLLRSGNIPVAYCMKFEYNGTVNHYTLAYNQYFSKYSPGIVFVAYQTEGLVRQGYFLDFSRGAHDYKSVITNRSYNNYRFTIFGSAAAAHAHDLRKRVRSARVVDQVLSNRSVYEIRERAKRAASKGLGNLIARVAKKLINILYSHEVALSFAHEGPPNPVSKPDFDVEVRELTKAQLPEVATFYGAPINGPKYQKLVKRFDAGADCFAVYSEGNIVTISWGLPVPDVEATTGFTLDPGPNGIALSDGVTSAPYRGKGLRSFLLHFQLDKYARDGKRVLLATMQTNHSMRAVVKKFNFSTIKTTHLIKVLGIRFRI